MRAQAEEQAAMAAAINAQAQIQMVAEKQMEAAAADASSVVELVLDANGAVSLGGEPIDSETLRAKLEEAGSAKFVMRVNNQCSFEHVSGLLTVFDELGLERPEFSVDAVDAESEPEPQSH